MFTQPEPHFHLLSSHNGMHLVTHANWLHRKEHKKSLIWNRSPKHVLMFTQPEPRFQQLSSQDAPDYSRQLVLTVQNCTFDLDLPNREFVVTEPEPQAYINV